jgi:hypothetical protein
MSDYWHDGMRERWVHPETAVSIDCAEMPTELLPAHALVDYTFGVGNE